MNLRKIVSLILIFAFILLLMTGIVLYIVPAGRIAYWADWKFIGLTKEQWGDLHIISGILGLTAGFIHIIYNWKLIVQYLKNRKKELRFFNTNFNTALLITVIFCLGTYFQIPPFSTILNWSESIKDSATETYGEPPYSHAELSTIRQFCETMQLDLNRALENLHAEGIDFKDENDVLKEVATQNNVSPQKLYLYIKAGNIADKITIPDLPPAGTGKKTLRIFCEQYNFDLQSTIDYLEDQQINASADMTLKEIAEKQQIEMIQLYNHLKKYAREQNFSEIN
jgi:predicted DNA-binding protein YlxM (UPF0122 family)